MSFLGLGGGGPKLAPVGDYARSLKSFGEAQGERQGLSLQEYRQLYDQTLAEYNTQTGKQDAMIGASWGVGQDYYSRMKQVYWPLEDQIIQRAQELDDPRMIAHKKAMAQAEAQQTYDAQRENATRQLSSMGIDPSQVMSGALDVNARNELAKTQALAANQMGEMMEQRADQALIAAAGQGSYLPQAQATSQGQAMQMASQQPGQYAQMMSVPLGYGQLAQGYGTQAIQGIQGGGDMINDWNRNSIAAYSAEQQYSLGNQLMGLASAGLGAVGGAATMKHLNAAEGGAVPEELAGGPPVGALPNSQSVDRHPTLLADGEYVIPADVMAWKGQEFFEKLTSKSREMKQQVAAPGAALPVGGAA